MISAAEIESLFSAQLEKIRNKNIREKTARTWELGCRKGGWKTLDALRRMPFSLQTESHGISLIAHTIAVTEGAASLARAQIEACGKLPYTVDFDRLYSGGLLHDVGKLLEIEADGSGGYRKSLSGSYARHPISGAILAHECGIPEDILNVIACHSGEGEGKPQVVETVFIHQADFASFDPLVMKARGLLIQPPSSSPV